MCSPFFFMMFKHLSQKKVMPSLKMNPWLGPWHANRQVISELSLQLLWITMEQSPPPSYHSFSFISTLSCSAAVLLLPPLTKTHTKLAKDERHSTIKPHLDQLAPRRHTETCFLSHTHTHTHLNSNVHSHPSLPISADLAHQSGWPLWPRTHTHTLHTDTVRMCWQGRDCRSLN